MRDSTASSGEALDLSRARHCSMAAIRARDCSGPVEAADFAEGDDDTVAALVALTVTSCVAWFGAEVS